METRRNQTNFQAIDYVTSKNFNKQNNAQN